MKRRNFLTFSAQGVLAWAATSITSIADVPFINLDMPYEVLYTLPLSNEGGYQRYQSGRKDFENVQAIAQVTESFMQQGRILRFSANEGEKGMQWRYLFKTRQDYKDWNKLVYHDGLYSRKKMPGEFSLRIDRRFVTSIEGWDSEFNRLG